jgi:two-component system, chemotaxis family, CheB/CheR fusion protein
MDRREEGNGFRVVCIGGSAGGLQAYVEILRGLPSDTGMAFVIAPHRGPQHSELLPSILRKATKMPVSEVEQGMRLEPDKVFVMPPRIEMTTAGNIFLLRRTPAPAGWPKTISTFLFSLAEAKGNRAVVVIVSGLDHDGVTALAAIKAAGGVTFAQSDAEYGSMPQHAIESGHIDHFLPSAEIAKELLRLANQA